MMVLPQAPRLLLPILARRLLVARRVTPARSWHSMNATPQRLAWSGYVLTYLLLIYSTTRQRKPIPSQVALVSVALPIPTLPHPVVVLHPKRVRVFGPTRSPWVRFLSTLSCTSTRLARNLSVEKSVPPIDGGVLDRWTSWSKLSRPMSKSMTLRSRCSPDSMDLVTISSSSICQPVADSRFR